MYLWNFCLKKKIAASAIPKETLRKFLENFACRSASGIESDIGAEAIFELAIGESLVEYARRLSSRLVDVINARMLENAVETEYVSAAFVFETIRILVVRIVAEKAGSQLDLPGLAEAYEALLELRLAGSPGAFALVESSNEKRKRGVFYTPDSLATDLTIRALLPLVSKGEQFEKMCDEPQAFIDESADSIISVMRILSLRIVDPSMGAGLLLLTALDVLTECIFRKLTLGGNEDDWNALREYVPDCPEQWRSGGSLNGEDQDRLRKLIAHVVARNCLFGLDIDSAAVELARIGMAMHCGLPVAEASRFQNLRHGNALLGIWRSPAKSEVAAALAKIGDNSVLKVVDRSSDNGFSERECRDIVCLQFFHSLISALGGKVSPSQILARLNFFHWDLEFAEVFSGSNPGFDAVITNPPWEIEKANSREFFSRWDPDFMMLAKQAALHRQKQLLENDSALADEWNYCKLYHEGLKNFLKGAGALEAEDAADGLEKPFRHQGGGDSNAYKLFLELGYCLLKNGGVVAQVVPSGIYSDKGATSLRRLFLERCRWLFLHGYHNRQGLFPIHRSFKFCTMAAIKGGFTNDVSCAFLRVSPTEFNESPVTYNVGLLRRLSAECLSFNEVTRVQDLQLVETLSRSATALGAIGGAKGLNEKSNDGAIVFRREFDMTNDSGLFIETSAALNDGFKKDLFGHLIKGAWRPIAKFNSRHSGEYVHSADGQFGLAIDDIAKVLLPVYEGRMIGQYDWAKKAWLNGKGRRAEWAEIAFGSKMLHPQYTMELSDYLSMQPERGAKIAYLAVGASTNARSCIAAMIGDWPCGNSVPVLSMSSDNNSPEQLCALLACLNSYVFDYHLRMRLSANNLNWFILQDCLVPDLHRLSQCAPLTAAVLELSNHEALQALGFDSLVAERLSRRARLRAFVEAVVADAYAINRDDCRMILRGCQFDESSRDSGSSIDKGFHRIDLHLPFQFRGPYLFARSFDLLKEKGLEWLFEHLDSDELFSQEQFEKLHLRTDGRLTRSETSVCPRPEPGNYSTLFNQIRSAGAPSSSLAKTLNTGSVGSPY